MDAGKVEGQVGKEIVVLADLHPDNLEAVVRARGVITEAGGAVAHLAQVARGANITIMRVEGARERFPKGVRLRLAPSEGRIRFVDTHLIQFVDTHLNNPPPDASPDEEEETAT